MTYVTFLEQNGYDGGLTVVPTGIASGLLIRWTKYKKSITASSLVVAILTSMTSMKGKMQTH